MWTFDCTGQQPLERLGDPLRLLGLRALGVLHEIDHAVARQPIDYTQPVPPVRTAELLGDVAALPLDQVHLTVALREDRLAPFLPLVRDVLADLEHALFLKERVRGATADPDRRLHQMVVGAVQGK